MFSVIISHTAHEFLKKHVPQNHALTVTGLMGKLGWGIPNKTYVTL